jgi:tetratricopeptide (TPR) repeat protein
MGGFLQNALALHQSGRLEEAKRLYEAYLARHPKDANILHLRGVLALQQGEAGLAVEKLKAAIALSPKQAAYHSNLGLACHSLGNLTEAAASYRQAIKLHPAYPEAHHNLAGALQNLGQAEAAEKHWREALRLKPAYPEAMSYLSGLRLKTDTLEAEALARQATLLAPNYLPAWVSLGRALEALERLPEALEACQRATSLNPQAPEPLINLGHILIAQGNISEAETILRKGQKLAPNHPELLDNLGLALAHQGQKEEAERLYRQAIAADSGHVQAHVNLAALLLQSGRLAEGWREYEWRFAQAPRYVDKFWDGPTSRAKSLLLWGEQGIGDEVLYLSLLPELLASGMDIHLEIDPRLFPLVERSFPSVKPVWPGGKALAEVEAQFPLAGLGRYLRPDMNSFPKQSSYFKADPHRVAEFLADKPKDMQRIGISWRSANRRFALAKSRPLEQWGPLLTGIKADFVALQYGDTEAERNHAQAKFGIAPRQYEHLDLTKDLDGLAALIASCDFIITTSNVTAHLAGALGAPGLVLLPSGRGRIWYWFAPESQTSPWYPSLKLLSHEQEIDWPAVLASLPR